jgi:PIN domain nuclease of toxin-antitoxin system
MQPTSVIDASALLAYLQAEPGVAAVANVLTPGRYIAAAEEKDIPFERADGGGVGEVGRTV